MKFHSQNGGVRREGSRLDEAYLSNRWELGVTIWGDDRPDDALSIPESLPRSRNVPGTFLVVTLDYHHPRLSNHRNFATAGSWEVGKVVA